jgi:hypothetical protein
MPSLRSVQLRGMLPPGRAGQGMVEDLAGCGGLQVLELAAPGEQPVADGLPSKACMPGGSGSGQGAAIPGWAFQRLVAGAAGGMLRRLVLGRAWAAAGRGRWGGQEVRLADVGQALGDGALPMLESCSVAVERQAQQQGGWGGWGEGHGWRSRLPPCGGAAGGGQGAAAAGGGWAQAEAEGAQGRASRVRLAVGGMHHVLYCPEDEVVLASSSWEACHQH